MNKQSFTLALAKAIEKAPQRKFNQTVDLIVSLKDLDLKKPDHQVDLFATMPHATGKPIKVCGLVGPEMIEAAKQELDFAIDVDSFDIYVKDKKKLKTLAKTYNYFVAQSNLMTKVAAAFGRVLGPQGKMPNPKSGCVVLPNTNLGQLKKRLQSTVRITVKTAPHFQTAIGKQDSPVDVIADNAFMVYDQIIHHLPNETDNIRFVAVKLTMGPAVVVGAEEAKDKKAAKGKKKN